MNGGIRYYNNPGSEPNSGVIGDRRYYNDPGCDPKGFYQDADKHNDSDSGNRQKEETSQQDPPTRQNKHIKSNHITKETEKEMKNSVIEGILRPVESSIAQR